MGEMVKKVWRGVKGSAMGGGVRGEEGVFYGLVIYGFCFGLGDRCRKVSNSALKLGNFFGFFYFLYFKTI